MSYTNDFRYFGAYVVWRDPTDYCPARMTGRSQSSSVTCRKKKKLVRSRSQILKLFVLLES